MKNLAENRNGIGAAQHFKPITPISSYRKSRSLMNQHNCRVILSVAAVVLAGLALAGPVLAAPQPETRHYVFTTVDFPGATGTEVLGFNSQTLVGDFADADGNTHGWLLRHGTGSSSNSTCRGPGLRAYRRSTTVDGSGAFTATIRRIRRDGMASS